MPPDKRLNIDCPVPVRKFFFIHLELYISSLMFDLIFENTGLHLDFGKHWINGYTREYFGF